MVSSKMGVAPMSKTILAPRFFRCCCCCFPWLLLLLLLYSTTTLVPIPALDQHATKRTRLFCNATDCFCCRCCCFCRFCCDGSIFGWKRFVVSRVKRDASTTRLTNERIMARLLPSPAISVSHPEWPWMMVGVGPQLCVVVSVEISLSSLPSLPCG